MPTEKCLHRSAYQFTQGIHWPCNQYPGQYTEHDEHHSACPVTGMLQGDPFLAGNATDWPILSFYINGGIPGILGLASLTQQYEMHPLAVCSNSLVCEYNIIDHFYYWWTDIWAVLGLALWNSATVKYLVILFLLAFLLAVFLRLELLELKV